MKAIHRLVLSCAVALFVFAITPSNSFALPSVVDTPGFAWMQGIGPWTSNFGTPASGVSIWRFSADVTGDGKSDAIVVANGNWYVAPSTGSGFGAYSTWIGNFGTPAGAAYQINLIAKDVSGDGKADAIAVVNGTWYVAKSTGSGFAAYGAWITNFGTPSPGSMVAPTVNIRAGDVTGDGKTDAIAIVQGNWYVAPSTGTSFSNNYSTWISNFGTGSGLTLETADVNGDARADAITVANGEWYVALSTGGNFASNYTTWISNFGAYAPNTTIDVIPADVNGDSRADAVAVTNGTWWIAPSTGKEFAKDYDSWHPNFGAPSSSYTVRRLLADATGDGKADAIATVDGGWYVAPARIVTDGILAQNSGWTLQWWDEFNGTALDTSHWNTIRNDSQFTNGHPYNEWEGAWYKAENNSISADGKLVQTVRTQPTQGLAYSTGMVNSKDHFSFKYGYVEARIKVPKCAYCWPTFWTLPADQSPFWPPELDIFEFFNTETNPRPVFGSHWYANNADGEEKINRDISEGDHTEQWHKFGLLWTPDFVEGFVDGIPGPKITQPEAVPHKFMYLLLIMQNFKYTSKFSDAGPVNSATPDGASMQTDYVRVYY